MNDKINTNQIDNKLDLILNEVKKTNDHITTIYPRPNVEKLIEALEDGQALTATDVQVIIKRSKPIALETMQELARDNEKYILRSGITRYGYKIMKDQYGLKKKIKAVFELLVDQKKQFPGRPPKIDLIEIQKYFKKEFNEDLPNDEIVKICMVLREIIPKIIYSHRNSPYLPVFEERFIIFRGNNLELFKIL